MRLFCDYSKIKQYICTINSINAYKSSEKLDYEQKESRKNTGISP